MQGELKHEKMVFTSLGLAGMSGGYKDDDLNKKPAAARKSKSKYNPDATCSKCKEKGHWRPSNKLCKYYNPPNKRKAPPNNTQADDPLNQDGADTGAPTTNETAPDMPVDNAPLDTPQLMKHSKCVKS